MKTLHALLLVCFLSLLPFVHIFFSSDLPHTSDGAVHLARMGAYAKAVWDGHVPVRWAGDLNYGYGLPLFNFMYHIPYVISTILLSLGFGLVFTFKLVLLLSFLISGVTMFLFVKALTGKNKAALFIAVLYQFAPFRLVEILVRGAIGGIYAYSFFPLVLYAITKRHFLLISVSTALLVLSHNSLALVFFGVIVLYVLLFSSKKIPVFLALASGLALTAFYWIPALAEHKFTYGDLFMKDLWRTNFPSLRNFFIPNLTNDARFRTAEINVFLGIIPVLAIIASLKHLRNKIILFSYILLSIAFFFMLPISSFLYERISFLRQFQFPWRFLAITPLATSLLAIPFIPKKQYLYWGILFITIISTVVFWKPVQGYDKINEQDYWNYPLNTTYFGETDVIWSAGPAKDYPKERVEVIGGKAVVSQFSKKTQAHTFTVDALTDAQLVDHTQYFPGWRAYVNGQKTPVEFQDQNWRGEITFVVPPGQHSVRVAFEESPLRMLADLLSLGTLTLLFILWFNKKL